MPDSIPFQTIAVSYVALLFSLSVHECAHAASAYWLEDDTAKRLGRMTLNPLAHIDLLGTLVLPLLGMVTGWRVLGWAKPVPVDPRRLSRRFSQRIGLAIVSAAGPASNILLSLLCILLLALAVRIYVSGMEGIDQLYVPGIKQYIFMRAIFVPAEELAKELEATLGHIFLITLLGKMVIINIGLAIFNLLPFGPLDGAGIMRGFLPWRLLPAFDRVQPILSIVILAMFLLGFIKVILEPLFMVAYNFYIVPLMKLLLL